MSNFAVGALYSSQRFLQLVCEQPITVGTFSSSYKRFEVADAAKILALVQQCGWVSVRDDGVMQLTERGIHIVGYGRAEICLRAQIADLVVIENPPWAKRILQGRYEARKTMPRAVEQCFDECGLFTGTEDDVVAWWDDVTQSVRSRRSSFFLAVGRAAERMTVLHEQTRTGEQPKWQSIESNVSGFDVLSKVEAGVDALLKIEVKGSTMRTKEASFMLTRNEWQTALNSHNYTFHLWLIHAQPKLFVVSVDDLAAHVPANQGDGAWESAMLRFRNFEGSEVSLTTENRAACQTIRTQLEAA